MATYTWYSHLLMALLALLVTPSVSLPDHLPDGSAVFVGIHHNADPAQFLPPGAHIQPHKEPLHTLSPLTGDSHSEIHSAVHTIQHQLREPGNSIPKIINRPGTPEDYSYIKLNVVGEPFPEVPSSNGPSSYPGYNPVSPINNFILTLTDDATKERSAPLNINYDAPAQVSIPPNPTYDVSPGAILFPQDPLQTYSSYSEVPASSVPIAKPSEDVQGEELYNGFLSTWWNTGSIQKAASGHIDHLWKSFTTGVGTKAAKKWKGFSKGVGLKVAKKSKKILIKVAPIVKKVIGAKAIESLFHSAGISAANFAEVGTPVVPNTVENRTPSAPYGAPLADTKLVEPEVIQASYSTPPQAPQLIYGAPPQVPQFTYDAPPQALLPTYGAPPQALLPTYGAPPQALLPTYGAVPQSLLPTDGASHLISQPLQIREVLEQGYGSPSVVAPIHNAILNLTDDITEDHIASLTAAYYSPAPVIAPLNPTSAVTPGAIFFSRDPLQTYSSYSEVPASSYPIEKPSEGVQLEEPHNGFLATWWNTGSIQVAVAGQTNHLWKSFTKSIGTKVAKKWKGFTKAVGKKVAKKSKKILIKAAPFVNTVIGAKAIASLLQGTGIHAAKVGEEVALGFPTVVGNQASSATYGAPLAESKPVKPKAVDASLTDIPQAPQPKYAVTLQDPQPTYGAPPQPPQPAYGAPLQTLQPKYVASPRTPQPTYGAPTLAPQPTYGVPPHSPQPQLVPEVPVKSYGAPIPAQPKIVPAPAQQPGFFNYIPPQAAHLFRNQGMNEAQ